MNMNRDLDAKIISLDLETTIRNRPGRFVLYREVAFHARRSKDWLIAGLLGAGEASAFFGAPGDGKSVLVEDLGLHVAASRPWHGRQVKGGAVVYFALERKALVERRLIAFQTEHDIADIPFVVCGGGGVLDFREAKVCKHITEVIKAAEAETDEKVVLIIIDTLSRALCGGDEAAKEMGAVVRATSILQEDGARHVLWVHHTPHGAERLRGHGSFEGAVDTAIHVSHDGSDIRRATVTKANDSEQGEQVAFTLKSVTIGPEGTTAPVVVPVENAPKATAKPKKTASKAITLTVDIINEVAHATLRPFNDNLTVRAANIETVREEFYRRYVAEPDAKRQAWHRAINDRTFVGHRDGKCWLT